MKLFAFLFIFVFFAFDFAYAEGEEANGNFFVAPSVFYYSGARTRNSEDRKSFLVYELQFAYQIFPSVFVGGSYQVENETTQSSGYSSASLNNTSKSARTSAGPTVGYVTSTFHALFTYFLDSKWGLDTTSSTGQNKYEYAGSGMQLDVGYKIPFGGIFFGPQLSYKKFSYGTLSTNGSSSSISPQLEEANFEPSLTLYFFF